MKPINFQFSIFLICLNLIFLLQSNNSMAQTYQIATYNIRFDNPKDLSDLWINRSPHLINLMIFHKMDIIGIQEGLYNQLEDIKKALDFPYIGVGRDDGGNTGEFSAIFYNSDKFSLLEHGTFWLSDTPETPSIGWDAALKRICTWAKFKDNVGKSFFVFNIHYDHVGQKAREESSKLVIRKINEINKNGLPVIFMGDFNVDPENRAYLTILEKSPLKDSRIISKTPSVGNQGTFNAFNWDILPDRIIDHIFVSPNIEVLRHGILTDNYGMKYPSDHFPVLVEVEFK